MRPKVVVAALALGFGPGPAMAQLALEGTASVASGRYIFAEPTTTWTFTAGVAGTAGRVTLRAALPLVTQNTTLITTSGTGMMPSGGSASGMVSDSGRQDRGGQRTRLPVPGTAVTGYRTVVADPVIGATIRVASGRTIGLTVGAVVKLPVTDTTELGTGALDLGVTIGLTRSIGSNFVTLDGSFWSLGDLPQLDFRNPVSATITAGHVFRQGWSVDVFASASTSAIEGYDAPASVGGGVTRWGRVASWGISATAGLSETAPDLSLAASVRVRL